MSVLCFKKLCFSRYPSHARIWVAPIHSGLVDQKKIDYDRAMDDWYHFVDETQTFYGVDMSSLSKPFTEEQRKYYLEVGVISFRKIETVRSIIPYTNYGLYIIFLVVFALLLK